MLREKKILENECALPAGNKLWGDMTMVDSLDEYVVQLLESYREREQKILALRYELSHPAKISFTEMIETMSLARGDGTGHSNGYVSNMTLHIALNYQENTDKLNEDTVHEIITQLTELEQIQDWVKYYVSLLDQRQAVIIRLFYFEGCTQDDAAKKLGIVPRTIRRIKKEAGGVIFSLPKTEAADFLSFGFFGGKSANCPRDSTCIVL